ncbi:MAG TPA: transglycosylase family protein [Solirubrobacteraceae bacterium]|nr:transglycosylase family protein [Solirubrobacteraceae bacterium]
MISSDDVVATDAAVPEDRDAKQTLAYRRSLRASRTRRAAASLRRRRVFRSRGSALVAVAGLLLVSGGAVAAQQGGQRASVSSNTITAVQRALDIPADGVVGPVTRGAVKRFQRKNKLIVDGVIGPQTLKALGIKRKRAVKDAGAARAASGGNGVLQRIAACESGGDPTAVSAGGRYRGKYQFSRATWRSMGGKGDPARASEAEQDRRAAKLLAQAGTSPWPNCA